MTKNFIFGALVSVFYLSGFSVEAAVKKADFLEGFKKSAANTFCGENTYFRKCFQVEKDVCSKAVNEKVGDCLSSAQKDFPDTLKNKEEGGNLGRKIGVCLGEKLEADWASKKKASADCSDPKKWN